MFLESSRGTVYQGAFSMASLVVDCLGSAVTPLQQNIEGWVDSVGCWRVNSDFVGCAGS